MSAYVPAMTFHPQPEPGTPTPGRSPHPIASPWPTA